MPDDQERAEREAHEALALFAQALYWAEDTPDEEGAHSDMDAAGKWVRETFGCHLLRDGTRYRQSCPIALAHNRIGFSVGGTARRVCSLCGQDVSECPHLPGTLYLVPGGPADLGWCRVCLKESCGHDGASQYPVSIVSIIRDMVVEEVSLVSKPAHPGARLQLVDIPTSELADALGADFRPGIEICCDRCLLACEGLTRPDLPHG